MHKPTENKVSKNEKFWIDYGKAYTDKNAHGGMYKENLLKTRSKFYDIFKALGNKNVSILEAGCGSGLNLEVLNKLGFTNLSGIDISDYAIRTLKQKLPNVNTRVGTIREMPYEDEQFDVVFSSGVLIHQEPKETLPTVMKEMDRCSKKTILGLEDYSKGTIDTTYQGERSRLFTGPFPSYWKKYNPSFKLITEAFIDRENPKHPERKQKWVVYRIDKF